MPAKGSKRRRLPDDQSGDAADHDIHQVFTQWAKDRGVEINSVTSKVMTNRGIGLITTKALAKGERILYIPERAMFTPDVPLLKRESLEHASPQAQLALSALMAFGSADSKMTVWKDVWPTSSDFIRSMPMCWSASTQKFLPLSAQHPLERQQSDYQRDWEAGKELCDKHGFQEDAFKYYWMIVNSRSFHWKPPRAKAGSMVMCPFIDYLNHAPTGSSCIVRQYARGYEVTANREYESGEEVFATYGAHSNDKLLVHYGFVLPDGPNVDDEVRLDPIILPTLDAKIREQLQDVGFLGGYALSPSTNEICFKTEVAMRVTMLTSNEWEYFIANGEDLSFDYRSNVRDALRGLLASYREEVVLVIERVLDTAMDDEAAGEVLTLRYRQILDAVDNFIHNEQT